MKKHNLLALLLALLLLLCGCSGQTESSGTKKLEDLFEKTAASLAEGHLFFTGKVTSALAEAKDISFYEAESEKNTFYKVEVTDDPFGCLPERTLTVCVLGNTENFIDRTPLQKGKEYLFDTTLWVQGEEAVLLLPTFYLVLPERQGDALYYTDQQTTAAVDGSYQDYLDQLRALAEENGYSAAGVLAAAKTRLESAVERDSAYFEALEFETVDSGALNTTIRTAKTLLAKANAAQPTWEGIEELLK
ncbi:MAG: hypothetical protein IJ043_05095 [Clostridia bacterium]|nr:hypothetical protein [Clostridia bacterium]